jgi:hypothetical protein
MRRHLWVFLGLILASYPPSSGKSQAPQPWVEPQDTAQALFDRDHYAWRLFVALNWPANVAQKAPDPSKAFGSEGSVVWETWRNARNTASDTVYRTDGADPGPWLSGPLQVARDLTNVDRIPRKQALMLAMRMILQDRPAPAFDEGALGFDEVRMNKQAYEFIREQTLYNLDGQITTIRSGAQISFPLTAKEIKAQWRRINEADKPRYHWAEVTAPGGAREAWGLIGLHIITKDLPNWFWATFEHVDNKSLGPGWQLPSVDRFACPAAPHDCNEAPKNVGLEGTKWANYRLRGAQVDFIDSTGAATRLANSTIELDQIHSSCMTCHSLAAKNKDGVSLGFQFVIGPPNENSFRDPGTKKQIFFQQDFVFSLDQAQRKQAQ